MRIDVGTFAIPELPYPSLWFSLTSIIHPLNRGFSEALDLPETGKDHLRLPFMPTRYLRQYNHAFCFFLLHQRARWGCSLAHKKISLEKGQGTASQSTWYSSADFQSVNTHNFACLITTKRKARWRQCCCFIAFQAGLNPHETVFSHPFFFLVPQRVLNRILYPNIMEERKYFSALTHTRL